MNYYSVHRGDEAKAMGHLTPQRFGLLARLRSKYIDIETGGGIPQALAADWAGARTRAELADLNLVLAEFFTLQDATYRRAEFDAVIAAYSAKSHKAKASANARWNSADRDAWQSDGDGNASAGRPHSDGYADAMRTHSDGNAPQNPKAKRNTDTPLPPDGGACGFDSIASSYPRRTGMKAARKEWDELAPDERLRADIASAIRAWIPSDEWQRNGGRFVPSFGKFLRDKRWLDAPGAADAGTPPVATPAPVLTEQQLAANKVRATEAAALARRTLGRGARHAHRGVQ